jgi:hypothetical protein
VRSLFVVFWHDPSTALATDTDAIFTADDIYLFGIAHTGCSDEARRRLLRVKSWSCPPSFPSS